MKIGHISDFHLRNHLPGPVRGPTRLGRLIPELLPAAVADLRREKLNLLAVTGDLLCYQYRDDVGPETPVQAIEDLRLLRDILEDVGCPSLVIPGNHDPEELVHQVFGPFPEEQSIDGFRVLCFRDSYVPGDFPGRAAQERRRLYGALNDRDTRMQIHLRHAVIWPKEVESNPPSREEIRILANSRALAESIGQSGRVKLVMSGHRHMGFPPAQVGATVFSTVPGFSDAPHSYRIYRLFKDHIDFEQRSVA